MSFVDRIRIRIPAIHLCRLTAVALLTILGAGLVGLHFGDIHADDAAPPKPLVKSPAEGDVRDAKVESARTNPDLGEAEMHVVGVYGPKDPNTKSVEVEVRATAKPLILVTTAYMSVNWKIKLADGARIKKVIVAGYFPQEITGVPEDVPVENRSNFPADGSRRKNGWFWSHQPNTPQWRQMVRKLNEITGLAVSSFQGVGDGTSFVVDGKLGSELAQDELKTDVPARTEPKLDALLKLSADAELHIAGVYWPNPAGQAQLVDVKVQATQKPIVLVLTSYQEAIWKVRLYQTARIKAVIVAGHGCQEVDGLPDEIPVFHFCPAASEIFEGRRLNNERESFYAYQPDTIEYRRMAEKLNDLTGLLVSSFQGEERSTSFVIDGKRGSELAQKERRPKPVIPVEPTPQELQSISAEAELHMVSINQAKTGNGGTVEVDVRPSEKPIVLAVVAYSSILWKLKIAEEAQVKAIIIGGYFEQEFEGIPKEIPIVIRTYFPSMQKDFFYGFRLDSPEFQQSVQRLNEMTGIAVSTLQLKDTGTSFVVDGKRGRTDAQKIRTFARTKDAQTVSKPPQKTEEDPAADVADIPSQQSQAGNDVDKRYYLIGPHTDAPVPENGFGLLVIMPGGDGSADFHPFVKRIYKHALSQQYIAAQPVAIKWTADQQIVWPTKKSPVGKMKFSTEEFVDAVIDDVATKHKIDKTKIYTLSWSSSGPAAYAISLQEKHRVTGSLIAMSVFKPNLLPALSEAKGHAYYLYHSKQDRVCPFRMADEAKTTLTENGAKVHLQTYEGGHGWRGNVYEDIRNGIDWMEKNQQDAPEQ